MDLPPGKYVQIEWWEQDSPPLVLKTYLEKTKAQRPLKQMNAPIFYCM